jgi:PhnB protein
MRRVTTSIAPWLSVPLGARAVDFYRTAFGATELQRVEYEAGQIVAQLTLGEAEFWVSDEPATSPDTLGGASARMILSVDDPDALFARAVGAGAVVVAEMYEGHGWRIGRVTDPFGHDWEIAKRLTSC